MEGQEAQDKAGRGTRRTIIKQIRQIQPQAGKNLKDLEVPQHLFDLAKKLVHDNDAGLRFNKVDVYGLLLGHLGRLKVSVAVSSILDGWKLASVSLFRYAVNLLLAPNRVEFKKMKVSIIHIIFMHMYYVMFLSLQLSTSYYVYNISRHLYRAERVFHAMGYKQTDKKEKKETQDLVYEGDVDFVSVLDTATDLLVMHEEVARLQSVVQQQDVPTMHSMLVHRQTQILEACKRAEVDPNFVLNNASFADQQQRSDPGHLHPQSQQPGMFQPDVKQVAPLSNAHEIMHQKQHVRPYVGPGGPQISGAVSQPMPSNQLQGGGGGFMPTVQGYPPQYVQEPPDQLMALPAGVPVDQALYQNAAQLHEQSWDGPKAYNPTFFQNVDRVGQQGLKYTPRPRVPRSGHYQVQQTTQDDGEMEQKNIHLMSMEKAKKEREGYDKQPSGDEESLNIADTLPPPVTTFHSPQGNTPYLGESGFDSGLLLSGVPIAPGGDSGPQGLKESQMAQYVDSPPITAPNPPLTLRTDSNMSEDIYGSGPALQGKVQQSISSILEENEKEERGWIYRSGSPTPPSRSAKMTTQGNEGQVPHEPSHLPVPVPRSKISTRTHSVDELENDHTINEDTETKMRRSKSGNNLKEMERQAHQMADKTHHLSSTLPSTDHSPSESPNSRRKRPTHEDWVIVPPSSPASQDPTSSSKELKIKTLPRQAKSVDKSRKGDREMPRFSSGSNIINYTPVPDQNNIEPQAPVIGKTNEDWIMKMKAGIAVQDASKNKQQKFSTPPSKMLSSAPPTIQQPSTDSTSNKPLPQPSTVSKDFSPVTENKPPLSPYKTEPVISTTKAEASHDTTSDQTRVDFGGDCAHVLRSTLCPSEDNPRKRVNAGPSSKSRPKPSTEQETSFTELTTNVNNPDDSFCELGSQRKPSSEQETSFTELTTTPLIKDDSFSELGLWVCTYCTNLNDISLNLCETCHQLQTDTHHNTL